VVSLIFCQLLKIQKDISDSPGTAITNYMLLGYLAFLSLTDNIKGAYNVIRPITACIWSS